MNRHPIFLASALAAALATSCGLPAPAWAQSPPEPAAPPAPPRAENPEVQAALEAAEAARAQARSQARAAADAEAAARYAEALAAAEVEQRAALASVEAARAELVQQAEAELREAEAMRKQAQEEMQAGEQSMRSQERQLRDEAIRQREQRREVQRELERAHENLRRASREVAQVHRELNRTGSARAPAPRFGANRAVIGVILGSSGDEGVQVLGLSPDGPAERAGLEAGDVIVSLMGEPLVENGSDGRIVLGEALREIEPGDELEIVVQRDGEAVEAVIVAEERTPFSWHSVSRLGAPVAPSPPGAPGAPDAPVVVQSFEFPSIDPEQLEREIEVLRGELEERRIVIDTRTIEDGEGIFYEFETLSEVGDAALAGTNIWFGVPLTRGLKFAELDAALGAYFDTDEGVLVLRAKQDNLLQLQSGDVIRAVNGTPVERPADVVRALRGLDSGESVELDIVRSQKRETLVVTIPEQRLGLFDGDFDFDGDVDFNELVFEHLHRAGQHAPEAEPRRFPQD
jgi:C-terminal processing protease CtpA/Prc